MEFSADQIKELSAQLDPKHVIKPTGRFGAKGDYIEGWHAIAEANRIFGHGGWSYSIDLIKDSVALGKGRDGNEQWQAAYSCICTVKAGDVERQDVGFGSGFAKQIGDAIEGATKEAATDSLKRALRTFGHPFGLALYDKKRANVASPEAGAPDYEIELKLEEIQACDTQMALKRWWKDNSETVPPAFYDRVFEAADKRGEQIKLMDRSAA